MSYLRGHQSWLESPYEAAAARGDAYEQWCEREGLNPEDGHEDAFEEAMEEAYQDHLESVAEDRADREADREWDDEPDYDY